MAILLGRNTNGSIIKGPGGNPGACLCCSFAPPPTRAYGDFIRIPPDDVFELWREDQNGLGHTMIQKLTQWINTGSASETMQPTSGAPQFRTHYHVFYSTNGSSSLSSWNFYAPLCDYYANVDDEQTGNGTVSGSVTLSPDKWVYGMQYPAGQVATGGFTVNTTPSLGSGWHKWSFFYLHDGQDREITRCQGPTASHPSGYIIRLFVEDNFLKIGYGPASSSETVVTPPWQELLDRWYPLAITTRFDRFVLRVNDPATFYTTGGSPDNGITITDSIGAFNGPTDFTLGLDNGGVFAGFNGEPNNTTNNVNAMLQTTGSTQLRRLSPFCVPFGVSTRSLRGRQFTYAQSPSPEVITDWSYLSAPDLDINRPQGSTDIAGMLGSSWQPATNLQNIGKLTMGGDAQTDPGGNLDTFQTGTVDTARLVEGENVVGGPYTYGFLGTADLDQDIQAGDYDLSGGANIGEFSVSMSNLQLIPIVPPEWRW